MLLLAFMHALAHGTEPQSDSPAPRYEIRTMALTGQPSPDGHGTIVGLATAAPVLNGHGEVLFIADLHAADMHIDAHALLRSSRPGELLQLLRSGDALPGGASFGWLRAADDICLGDTGEVAVYVPVDAEDRVLNVLYRIEADGGIEAIYTADGPSGLSARFALGEDGEVEVDPGFKPDGWSRPAFNARGQVAFVADRALHLADTDGAIHTLVRAGDEFAGGRIVDLRFAGDEPCRRGFNDAGQVVFYARIDTGDGVREGIFLAAPFPP